MIGTYTSFSSEDYATPHVMVRHSQKAVITDGPLGYYTLYSYYAQRAIENALAFRAVEVHTLVHELRKLLPQLLAI